MSASTPLFFHTRAAFPVLPAQLAAFSFVPEGDPKNLALELSLLCLLSSEGCRLSRPRMPKRLGRIAGQRGNIRAGPTDHLLISVVASHSIFGISTFSYR